MQTLLTRYALERLLYRVSRSHDGSMLILKGAFLFVVWEGNVARPTRDLDFLALGRPEITRFEDMFRGICDQEVVDDGLRFASDSVKGQAIREASLHEGIRIKLLARLGNARLPIQVDIGFGDSIEPPPTTVNYPTLLGFPAPKVKAYRRELVIAEKFEAMVARGSVTSRLKDYYDIWKLSQSFSFDLHQLASAVAATFNRRNTELPARIPPCLTAELTSDPDRIRQWNHLVRRIDPHASAPTLGHTAEAISSFVMPTVWAATAESTASASWPRGGPWKESPA